MTNTRKRLPEEVFWADFAFVLKMAAERGLLKGRSIAVDSTMLEANAAMKSLVRRATNEDWKTYVKRLMKAEGIENPNDEEVRRFDRKRKKKTSNKEWKSPTDEDSRVARMKDGRTHLAYKAETLQTLAEVQHVRAYIAEPKQTRRRRWQDKEPGQQEAVYANRRRIQGSRRAPTRTHGAFQRAAKPASLGRGVRS